jgi:O-antigen/teichoic acid export membrane protein
MVIVTPFLTKEPVVYGIFTVCMSVTMFLNYADLGFLRASQKYAAECYAKGDREEEVKYIGFGTFVLTIFSIVIAAVFVYFGFKPQCLLQGLDTPEKVNIASSLLIILALFTPVTVLQRMVSAVFDIRLDSYIPQRIQLVGSLISIFSVFYFFRNGNYRIVDYFLFSQCINIVTILVMIVILQRKYKYNLQLLGRSLKFDIEIFRKSKGLAFTSLYIMIVWILFYEFDQIAIGKFLGVKKVAVYSIALTFSSLFRNVFSIYFSPYANRVNYFIGENDEDGLKKFTMQLILLSAPVVIFPTVALAIVSDNFILSWVGPNFKESIEIARLFSIIFIFGFFSYPISMVLVAKGKIKELNVIATIQPFVYWIGVLLSYNLIDLLAFPIFKVAATFMSDLVSFYLVLKYFNCRMAFFFSKVLKPLILPLCFLVLSCFIAGTYLPEDKSKLNFIIVMCTIGLCIFGSSVILYFSSKELKESVQVVIKKFQPQINES